jgi:hypothetical protein
LGRRIFGQRILVRIGARIQQAGAGLEEEALRTELLTRAADQGRATVQTCASSFHIDLAAMAATDTTGKNRK